MKEIHTRTEHMWLDESGILRCLVKSGVVMDLEAAKDNIESVRQLTGGKRVPVLVDMTLTSGATREARAYLASDEVAALQLACALIVNSPFSRLLGNFFLGLNKTKFPVRLFDNERDAVMWLSTFF